MPLEEGGLWLLTPCRSITGNLHDKRPALYQVSQKKMKILLPFFEQKNTLKLLATPITGG